MATLQLAGMMTVGSSLDFRVLPLADGEIEQWHAEFARLDRCRNLCPSSVVVEPDELRRNNNNIVHASVAGPA